MKTKYFILITITACLNYTSSAQNSCTENLIRANELYESGQVKECISICNTSLETCNSVTDRWQAYRMLALAYLNMNEATNARKAAIEMLKLNPTYKTSAIKDPVAFAQLLKSITVIPNFSLGLALNLGGNTTLPVITSIYNAGNYKKKYLPAQSYQLGIQAGYHISKHISTHLGLLYSTRQYGIKYTYADWNIKINETLNYLDFPFLIRYSPFPNHKWRPYIEGGFYGSYLLHSENNFERVGVKTDAKFTNEKVDSRNRRNLFSNGFLGGLGLSFRTNQGHFFVSGTYAYSMQNITKTSTRYKSANNIYNYYYLDDDIKLNNIAITIGYTLYLNFKVLNK